jgi:glycopeptide antibiotics resistance protein
LFFAYCGVVAWVTLRSYPVPNGSVDLIPFADTWQKMRDFGDRSALLEVAGNFALFIPFGYFLQAAFRRRLGVTYAIGALAPVAIETYQALAATGRNPSIDDVMFNALGAATGATLFVLVRGAVLLRRDRRDDRGGGLRRRDRRATSLQSRSDGRMQAAAGSEEGLR